MGWEADAVLRQGDIARASIPSQSSGGSMGWVGPAIMGASGVASSVTGGKAAKEAAKAQAASQDKALAFAREQEAMRQAQYGQAFKMWHASQNALRERYGLPPLPPMEAFPAGGGPVAAEPRMAAVPRGRPAMATEMGAAPQGATIRDMISADPAAELESWNDWSRNRLA